MKKTTLLILGLLFASVQTFADTRATALLLHNGQGKSFDADQLLQAVNEAVSGDTICLSEGTFNANEDLVLNKAIVIMGAGETTRLQGNVSIGIDGNPEVLVHMLDGLRVTGNVIVTKEQRGLKIRKCWIGGYVYSIATLTDLQIERCFVMGLVPVTSMKSVLCVNSIIYQLGPYNSGKTCNTIGNELTFHNCSIAQIFSPTDGNLQGLTFVNCVIASYNSVSHIGNNMFINSLCRTTPSAYYGDATQNCYIDSTLGASGDFNHFVTFNLNGRNLTNELLTEKGYLGNDGIAVGAYGGTVPYSLVPDGLVIRESLLRVDPATRQLNVTLKVATE